ncbi:restriction endonuclease [Arthrobacter citreus]|uniref:restriction endonuclease n=1 Tax=Arthrobacter citreus TaxID=1670 RepID=UPI0036D89195
MYWLLSDAKKAEIRGVMTALVQQLSVISGTNQQDQLFPFVGRKDRRKSTAIVKGLTAPGDTIVDPFSGSGIFTYAALDAGRESLGNEWEPYTYRMSSAPWRLPGTLDIEMAVSDLSDTKERINELYSFVCLCGSPHALDSQFFDRVPLSYNHVTAHERLGKNGETITFRGAYACPVCGATEKMFEAADTANMIAVNSIPLPKQYADIFDRRLIPNSRINLSGPFTTYGNLFPHRSKLALTYLWDGIQELDVGGDVKDFLIDSFLSILPQAKFKDYRSKSQDLHVPEKQLREVNLWNRFVQQVKRRSQGMRTYSFAAPNSDSPISSMDYRKFLLRLKDNSARLVLTDPPWSDGNAYFEKAQLYHPWLGFNLRDDLARLRDEVVVTDAPERSGSHDIDRWWTDIDELFRQSYRVVEKDGFLALFFRPIRASDWLANLNQLKLYARKNGFEPLLAIDVSSSDPSMRIQQSASFAFSSDIVFAFLKLDSSVRRKFVKDVDLDHLAYLAAASLQEKIRGPFTRPEWQTELARLAVEQDIPEINTERYASELSLLFERYTDQTTLPGQYLPKSETPFSGQLFDVPAIERLFTYVPIVVEDLTRGGQSFSYDMFLLRLSEYVENGTRMLINEVQNADLRRLLLTYAVPVRGDSSRFVRRSAPQLPDGIKHILELDPYDFEGFVAELLARQGYTNIGLAGRSGDRGVDVIATNPAGEVTVVQCKRYIRAKVGSEPVQRLHSFATTRGADKRIVITTSSFTADAIDEARLTGTELIDGTLLETLVATHMQDLDIGR